MSNAATLTATRIRFIVIFPKACGPIVGKGCFPKKRNSGDSVLIATLAEIRPERCLQAHIPTQSSMRLPGQHGPDRGNWDREIGTVSSSSHRLRQSAPRNA